MGEVERLLAELQRRQLANPLDIHFARLMCRLDEGGSLPLALAAALVSRYTGDGHVCLPLARLRVDDLEGGGGVESMLEIPTAGRWIESLRASTVVGMPGEYRPLILDEGGRLYLHRYWHYEARLATALLARRGATAESELDEAALKRVLARLFDTAPEHPDWQKVAAATAVLQRFCVISGGPGTGKTRTVARVLALLVEMFGEGLRIALAAPTGKAAARLQESLSAAKGELPVEEGVRSAIPEQAVTLHRLLGGTSDGVGFRFDAGNPLPLDVLIVDEASMVDIAMMAHLVEALPAGARLILLGDKDQLASVEAGAVLGDICGPAPGFPEGFARRVAGVTGEPVESDGAAQGLSDSIVLLRHSYRFSGDSGIGRLADAVRLGDAQAAWQLLVSEEVSDVGWVSSVRRDALAAGFHAYLQRLGEGAPPAEVFEAYGRFRLLCAVRHGPRGVEEVNRMVEQALAHTAGFDPRDPWYPGRPVMVVRNDYALRLYNGDIGIVMSSGGQQAQVCFPLPDGGYRWISVARMPPHETAFAMTVHKSQGSEFDTVHLLLPERDSPLLMRELIYTAITRARQRFVVSGPEALCRQAITRRLDRWSGLEERLWGRNLLAP